MLRLGMGMRLGCGVRYLTVVYTDGACLRNGKKGARAGVGVYFGEGDERNVSERLEGDLQTNQRAELTAALRALQLVPREEGMELYSDSKYTVNAMTVWRRSWRASGWAKPLANYDLFRALDAVLEEREACEVSTLCKYVRAHAGCDGNEAADRLAKAGAERAQASQQSPSEQSPSEARVL